MAGKMFTTNEMIGISSRELMLNTNVNYYKRRLSLPRKKNHEVQMMMIKTVNVMYLDAVEKSEQNGIKKLTIKIAQKRSI